MHFEVFIFLLAVFRVKKGRKIIYVNKTWATFRHSSFCSAKQGSQFSPKKNQFRNAEQGIQFFSTDKGNVFPDSAFGLWNESTNQEIR